MNISHDLIINKQTTIYRADGSIKNVITTDNKQKLGSTLDIKIKDSAGNIIKTHSQPFQSWLINWAKVWFAGVYGTTNYVPSTSDKVFLVSTGTFFSGIYDDNTYFFKALSGSQTKQDPTVGLVIGRGAGTLSGDNTALTTFIAEGVLNDYEINYGANYIEDHIIGGNFSGFTMRRIFTNSRPETMEITEAGIYTTFRAHSGANNPSEFQGLLARDIINDLGDPISLTLAQHQTGELVYTFLLDQNIFYTHHYYNAMISYMNKMNPASITDTSGTPRNINTSTCEFLECLPDVNDDSYGIVVGTGNTAKTIEDYKLQTKIPEGEGSGQIVHQVSQTDSPVWGTSASTFNIKRNFTNRDSASININEAGIYIKGNGTNRICAARSVYDSPITLEEDESVQVMYIFTYEV